MNLIHGTLFGHNIIQMIDSLGRVRNCSESRHVALPSTSVGPLCQTKL